jgi:rhodanese-related sulfurtransferase
MQTISTEELKRMKQDDESFQLINVLSRDHFQEDHIPGSENVPLSTPDFVDDVERTIGGKDKTVVVYCASAECDASSKAARRLEEAGFQHVLCYEGGTKAWNESQAQMAEA